jgi:Tol biopolymer transport system component
MLPGTELAGGDRPPFWSPDSRFLAFYGSHQIKKVDLTGSPPVPICTTEGLPLGGSWSRAGITFGGDTRGIMLVSDKGGEARRLTALDAARGDRIHAFATVLPDGRHFVYSRFSKIAENTGVYVGSLDARPQDQGHKQLVATQHMAVFVPNQEGNGRLLYLRDGVLWAQELDTSRLELSGDPARVAEHVGAYLGLGFFTASAGDIMIYRNGTGHLSQLAWFDRQGKRLGSVGEAMRPESLPVLSPDGKRLAVSLFDGISPSLWMYDLVRNTRQRLTLERGMESAMRWSRDGNRLVFSSNRSGHYDLYQLAASGDGAVDLLYASGNNKFPSGESPDGKFLLYETRDGGSKRAIWILPMDGTGKHAGVPIGRTDANEALAEFSPDGRWIAYVSDSTGTPEVYVREFAPGPAGYLNGPTLQLSNRGGFDPQWTANRKELLYTALDGAVMSVAVSPGPTLQPGPPRVLFSKPKNWVGPASADGQRFLLAVPPEQTAPQPFTVVLNWQAGLHK